MLKNNVIVHDGEWIEEIVAKNNKDNYRKTVIKSGQREEKREKRKKRREKKEEKGEKKERKKKRGK